MLQLGATDAFPVGRVVTLWRNRRWREMVTRWYSTELGREMFTTLSTWEWMASMRVDNVSGEDRDNQAGY